MEDGWPHILVCLNTWNCLERIARYDLVEGGMSLGVDFGVSKDSSVLPLCLLLLDQDVSYWLLLHHHGSNS